ncbi:Protein of unknown function [Streptomyces sp. cf386]|nr:Protein of unknown function [Streptomyces sp. cf386]
MNQDEDRDRDMDPDRDEDQSHDRPEAAAASLADREQAILALERRGFPGPGAKERAIREELGLAPVRYYQLLNALLDDRRALAHDPVTVNRLRRVREARRAER